MPTPALTSSVAKAAAAARWDGGPSCDPVKTAMRTRGSAAVVAVDRLGDADGLLAALALDDGRQRELQPAGELVDALQARAQPDLRADRHRRGEAHLVQAVVDAHHRVGDEEHLRGERREQGQGQVAVGDRAAEGALGFRALDVDVDPLVVTGRLGELVHVLLGDLVPVAGAELAADQSGQLGHRRRGGHVVRSSGMDGRGVRADPACQWARTSSAKPISFFAMCPGKVAKAAARSGEVRYAASASWKAARSPSWATAQVNVSSSAAPRANRTRKPYCSRVGSTVGNHAVKAARWPGSNQ